MESLGPHQILYVEPDAALAHEAKRLMSEWGLQVSIANNGREAIELTKFLVYDVIFIAVKSEDIEGYETARIIRQLDDQFRDIPIIGIGRTDLTDLKREYGLNDFIINTYNQTELYNILKNHLDKGQPDVVMANLDRCTDGDPEFRRELAQLLANNISELLANIEKALAQKDPNIFTRAVHKTKTTLSILNDGELTEDIGIVQAKLKEAEPVDLEMFVEKLSNRCRQTIGILHQLSAA